MRTTNRDDRPLTDRRVAASLVSPRSLRPQAHRAAVRLAGVHVTSPQLIRGDTRRSRNRSSPQLIRGDTRRSRCQADMAASGSTASSPNASASCVRDVAAAHVETVTEEPIAPERLARAEVGEREHVRQRHVVQRIRRRTRHRSRHVRDAVVHDAVDHIGRFVVGRRPRGREAATLIDRHVHQHGADVHLGHHVLRHQPRGAAALHQYGADHEISADHQVVQRRRRGVHGSQRRAEPLREPIEHADVAIEHRDGCIEADSHLDRVLPYDTATDDHHVRGRHAGDAAQQESGAALRALQAMGAGLHRHSPGHLRHRSEQREPPGGVGHGFVRHARGAARDQVVGLVGVGCQVQVGEQHVVGAQHRSLGRLRLLHLHDEVRAVEDLLGRIDDPCAGRGIRRVGCADADACRRLDQHVVTVRYQLTHTRRCQADPSLGVLDLLGYPDSHDRPPSANDAGSGDVDEERISAGGKNLGNGGIAGGCC